MDSRPRFAPDRSVAALKLMTTRSLIVFMNRLGESREGVGKSHPLQISSAAATGAGRIARALGSCRHARNARGYYGSDLIPEASAFLAGISTASNLTPRRHRWSAALPSLTVTRSRFTASASASMGLTRPNPQTCNDAKGQAYLQRSHSPQVRERRHMRKSSLCAFSNAASALQPIAPFL